MRYLYITSDKKGTYVCYKPRVHIWLRSKWHREWSSEVSKMWWTMSFLQEQLLSIIAASYYKLLCRYSASARKVF